jgi:hypothetical protein
MLLEFPPARCWLTSWSIRDTPGDGLRLCGLLPRLCSNNVDELRRIG